MHQTLMMSAGGVALDFPAWLRITHFINFLMIGLLIRSGWEVIASHPRFYWNNHCTPGSEWLKFTKDKVSTVPGEYTARDDQRSLSPLISLPGKAQIGLGRAWHALTTVIWIANGLVYVSLLFITGQWRRIVPTSWDIFPSPSRFTRVSKSPLLSISNPTMRFRSSCTSPWFSSWHH